MFSPYLITLVIYLSVIGFIGYIGYRNTKDLSGYILGNRQFGSFVTALSVGASDMSGWLLMGLPGAVFTYGLSQSWIGVGLFLGAWINWLFVAGRLRKKTEELGDAQTLPEYFGNRFPEYKEILRILSAIVIIVFFTFYCASGVVASGKLLEVSFGLDYSYAVWVGALMTISYVYFGGLFAVSWTDTLQAVLMIIALLLVPAMAYLSITGTFADYVPQIPQGEEFTSMTYNLGFVSYISSLAWGLGYFGQPHILVRFMAAKDSGKTMTQARFIAMGWMLLCLLGALAIGFYGRLFFIQTGHGEIDPENIFLELGKVLFNPWIGGFLLSAVLSAIMSTLSSQLLIGSASLSRDIYPKFFKKQLTTEQEVAVGRGSLLLISIASILLALSPDSSILSMVSYAWAGFGCSFGSVLLLSLISNRITGLGAICGMITGVVTVLIWEMIDQIGLYSMVPGFTLSVLVTLGVSHLVKKP